MFLSLENPNFFDSVPTKESVICDCQIHLNGTVQFNHGWQPDSYTLVSHIRQLSSMPWAFPIETSNGNIFHLKKLIREEYKHGMFTDTNTVDLCDRNSPGSLSTQFTAC
jgi:hypothetical protein